MAEVMYHEARGEPHEGKASVAQVVMNRVKSKERYFKNTVCEVVYQRGQFEWTADLPRHSNHRHHEKEVWERLQIKAFIILVSDRMGIQYAPDEVQDSTFFSRGGFKNPRLQFDAMIGEHRFFSIIQDDKV